MGTWLAGGRLDRAAIDLADVSGDPVDRVFLTALIILSLMVLYSRQERIKVILANNKWLVLLFMYMALSIVWSNFPAISFRRFIRSTGAFLMVLVVLTEHNPLGAIRTLLKRIYLVHIPLSIMTIKYFRSIGVAYTWDGNEEMWLGLSVHKNNLGQVAMCSGLYSAWQVLQNWTKKKLTLDLLLLALSLWVLRGSKNSHSSTAILGFIVSAAFLVGLQFIKKRTARAKHIVVAALIASVVVGPLVILGFQALETTPVRMVLNATGRDITFSGRDALWTDLLTNAARNPLLGVGIGAFWVGPVGYADYPLPNWSTKTPEWRPNEGHNGYIDVYVELGVLGGVLLVLAIGSAFASALNDLQYEFELGSIRLVLLLSIVINNLTESSFLRGTHSLWFVFLLVAVSVPKTSRRIQSEENGGAAEPFGLRGLKNGSEHRFGRLGPYLLWSNFRQTAVATEMRKWFSNNYCRTEGRCLVPIPR